MLKRFCKAMSICLLSTIILAEESVEIKFSQEEINYIHDSKEDTVYISSDIKSIINKLNEKGIIQNPEHDLKQLVEACAKDWKVVPARIIEQAINQVSKIVEDNKDNLSNDYESTKKDLETYKQQLATKEAQFFFRTRQEASNDQVVDTGVFNTLIVNDILRAKNILRVNYPDGSLAFKVEPLVPLSVCNVPLRVEFQQSGTNALTVIGNATISGNLNADSIKAGGSTVIVSADNVGSGTGIFKNKSGDTLNFKSLVAGTNVSFDTSNPNQIRISAAGGAGGGDVNGPSSSTNNAIARFDGTTGKIIQNSLVTINDVGNVITPGNFNLSTGPSTANAGMITQNSQPFIHNVGQQNFFAGRNAGGSLSTATESNTGVGANALSSLTPTIAETASFNTAVGHNALKNLTRGFSNTAVGFEALKFLTNESDNSAFGIGALFNNQGSGNTALGTFAMGGDNEVTGNFNIAVGHSAGTNITSGDTNIMIGNSGVVNDDSTIRIGDKDNQDKCFIAGIAGSTGAGATDPVYINPNTGRLSNIQAPSSIKYKREIEDINELITTNICKLRPVKYKYNLDIDSSARTHYGLVAEEVKEVLPELVINNEKGEPEGIKYQILPILLLNVIKKLQQDFTQQKEMFNKKIQELEKIILNK